MLPRARASPSIRGLSAPRAQLWSETARVTDKSGDLQPDLSDTPAGAGRQEKPMPTFQTPDRISVSLEFGVGDLRLVASHLSETVVEVKPTDPAKKGDVNAANQTQVEFASGALIVKAPKSWRQWTPGGGRESIDIAIHLPEDSRVTADVGMAAIHSSGRLAELDLKTGMGDVRVAEARSVKIRTGFGEVAVGRVEGDADVKTGSGRIEIGSVGGSATVKNSNGDTRIV